jgi:Tol biopolymer transport system component
MKLDRFDYLVWSILGALLLALLALIVIGDRVGAQVVQTFPVDGAVTARGRVGVEFGQLMQADSVAARFSLTPTVPGQIRWVGQQAIFMPAQPFRPGQTYTAALSAGAQSQNGRLVQGDYVWSFTAQPPALLYLAPASKGALDVWIAAPGAEPRALTRSGGQVYDYAPAPDGSRIAYSVLNAHKGLDLWLMDRDGQNPRVLVDCGPNRCAVPHWSPTSERIAYSREEVGLAPGAPNGPPRVWTVLVSTGQTRPLYQDSQVLGYGPEWSPDGRRLAFFDGSVGGIRVLDLMGGGEMILPTYMGLVGTFSPDGQQMLYTDIQTQQERVVSILYLADFATQTLTRPFSESANLSDFGTPAWSPTGEWIVLAARDQTGGPGKQLWMMHPDGTAARPITNDPAYTHGSYHWDAWGETLVYQRVSLGTPYPQPEIMLWSRLTGAAQPIALDGTLPNWMP